MKRRVQDLGAMNLVKLCGELDALMSEKEAQVEITKVQNYEESCIKLKVLENNSSSKKKGARIVTKCSYVVWNNDEVIMDRISIVKKGNGFQKEGS